ncbi:MAG: type II toxin-antitoxin system RelE family toxin [Spirochaeta sp.]
MSYSVEFISEAAQDYQKLDGSIKKLVNKKIDELSEKPFLGDALGNKHNIDLTGFYKMYVARKTVRIIYRLISPSKIEVIEIWGIGKRDKEEIYRILGKRIRNQHSNM